MALIIIVRTLIRCQIYIPGGSGGGGISGGDWESADGEGEELVQYLPSITPTPSDPKKQEEKEQEEKEQEEKEQEKKGQKKKGQ